MPQIKEIHHPALLQEWKLNLYAEEYDFFLMAYMYKPSEKKKIDCVDSDDHCPTSTKETIQWFLFLIIMEHTTKKKG